MDAGGEGVVAIVQGLRDAGLAVTLVKRGHLQNSIRRSKKIPITKSSVETSTEHQAQRSNASSQVCDGHYTSSYQLAHCGFTPSSPPVTHSEFPLQRIRPSRSKGNFEVQGLACGETSNHSTPSPSFGRPLMCVRRGSSISGPPSPKANVSFMDSLRKYSVTPKIPDKSVSSELVQRLLDYTQAKYLSRDNSSILRSLRNKSSRQSRDGRDKTSRNSKIVHTYIQAFNKVSQKEEAVKKQRKSRRISNTDSRGTEKEQKQTKKLSNTDARLDHLDQTYNYLNYNKSRSYYSGQTSDVRYLDEVKQCIRQTIRQMADTSTSECPMIKSRYSLHRRMHHQRSAGTAHSDMACASVQGRCNMRKKSVSIVCDTSSRCSAQRSSINQNNEDSDLTAPDDVNICSTLRSRLDQHKKSDHSSFQTETDDEIPVPENQDAMSFTRVLPRCWPPPGTITTLSQNCSCRKTETSATETEDQGTETEEKEEEEEEEEKPSNITTEAEKQILEWLEEIPFPVDEKREAKAKRQELVKQLVNKLNSLLDQDDFEEKSKEEIDKFVESLAIQFPEDEEDYEMLKNNITKDLFIKLFEVDYDAHNLNFNEIISQWLDEIDLDIKNEKGKRISKKKLVKLFLNHLKPILNGSHTEEELKQGILRILPMPTTAMGANIKNDMFEVADKLVNSLIPILKRRDNIKNKFGHKKENVLSVQPNINTLNKTVSSPSIDRTQDSESGQLLDGLESEANVSEENDKSLVKKFDEKRKDLQSINANKEVMEEEHNKFMKSLPEIGISLSPTQNRELSRKMLNDEKSKLKRNKNQTKRTTNLQPVTDWLENESNIPKEAKDNNKNLVKTFDQKSKEFQSKNTDTEITENEINDFIKSLPENGIQLSPKHQLAKKTNKTESKPKKDKSEAQRNVQPVKDWLDNMSNFPEEADNDVTNEEIDVMKSLPENEIQLSPAHKQQPAGKMPNEIKSKPKQNKGKANQRVQPVRGQLEIVSNIPEAAKEENKSLTKKFNSKPKDFKSEYDKNYTPEEETNDFLKSLSRKINSLPSTQKHELAGNIQNEIKLKSQKNKNKANHSVQPVTNWLENELNLSNGSPQQKRLDKGIQNEESQTLIVDSTRLSETKQKEIIERIVDLLTLNPRNMSNSEIKDQIADILKNEAKVPASEVSDITNAIINKIAAMQSWSSNSQRPINTNSKLVEEKDVHSILNNHDLLVANVNKDGKSSADAKNDQILSVTNDNAEKRMLEILQNTNISKADAKEISNKLMKRNAEKSPNDKTRDPVSEMDKIRTTKSASHDSMEKQTLEKNTGNDVLNFIMNKTGDDHPEIKRKRTEDAIQLREKFTGTVSSPKKRDRDVNIVSEISGNLERSSVKTSEPLEEQSQQHSVQKSAFHTSTPKKKNQNFPETSSMSSKNHNSESSVGLLKNKSSSDDSASEDDSDYDTNKLLFYPHENKPQSHDDNPTPNSSLNLTNVTDTEHNSEDFVDTEHNGENIIHESITQSSEQNYVKELKKVIKSWMDETQLNLDVSYNSGFKETMVSDLAGDIVDRQKYLQLSHINTSPTEELEHLKYQVYRWLNKLVDVERLSSIMPEIPTLMDKLKNVTVPQLVGEKHFNEQQHQTKLPKMIKTWIDGMDFNLVSEMDKVKLKENVPEFVKVIQQMELNNEIDDTKKILEGIAPLIKSVNKYIERQDLLKMAESLKFSLNKGDSSHILTQDTNEFIEENLAGALQDWLKMQPLHQNRNSNDKRIQESIMNDLAKRLITVFEQAPILGTDIDSYLIEEINKHVQQFPLDPRLKSNQDFMDKLPHVILDYLKGLKLFQDISQRHDSQDESIKNIVNRWVDDLPRSKMNSLEKTDFENLKEQFISRINHLQQSETSNKSSIRDEIANFLGNIPIRFENMNENQKKKSLDELGDQLLHNLTQVSSKTSLSVGSNKFIKNAVAQWIKTLVLPESDDPTVFEQILSKAQDDLITTLSSIFLYTDKVPLTNISKIFEEVTAQFLEELPVNPYTTEEMEILADSLLDTFKECSKKYPITPAAKKKAADVLLDDIANWVQNLPIEANTSTEKEQAEKIKQQIESKLIHKIGELNMNPEVFNDDFLYEDMLQDEIDSLLINTASANVKKNLAILRKGLMDKVKEARQKIRDENIGQVYKQQLREAISKTLLFLDLTADEQASFEVLKDDVADAFINLHYVGCNEDQVSKLQNKINTEINKFCNDYLKRRPATPIDARMLNEELYNALKNISEPNNESYQEEIELLKLKDVVKDWVNELPLKEPTGKNKLLTNKMISVLAKKLHDIEIEKEWIPNAGNKMNNEIVKFMKKLPLLIKENESIDLYAEKLLNDLKNSEKSRMLSVTTRNSIELDLDCNDCMSSMPPCMLSMTDRAHLGKIRERIPRARLRFKPKPVLTDAYKCTHIKSCCIGTCCGLDAQQDVQIPQQKTKAVQSQENVSPRVVIKDYYWDSVNETSVAHSVPSTTSTLQQTVSESAPKSCLVTSHPSTNIPQCSKNLTRTCGSQYQIPCIPKTCTSTQYEPPSKTVSCRLEKNLHPKGNFSLPQPSSAVTQHPMPEQNRAPQPRVYSNPNQFSHSGSRQNTSPNQNPCPSAHCSSRLCQSPVSSQGSAFHAQPCNSQRRIPNSSSPRQANISRHNNLISSEETELGPNCSFQNPRVTKLGSFDSDVQIDCRNRHRRWSKRPMSNDEYCWERNRNQRYFRPCAGNEREYVESKRYRCRQQPMLRCTRRSYEMDSMKTCSKCCGVHCPHPSYMYFRP